MNLGEETQYFSTSKEYGVKNSKEMENGHITYLDPLQHVSQRNKINMNPPSLTLRADTQLQVPSIYDMALHEERF
jgi:hypothetical protein